MFNKDDYSSSGTMALFKRLKNIQYFHILSLIMLCSGITFLIARFLVFVKLLPIAITDELILGYDLNSLAGVVHMVLNGNNPYAEGFRYLPLTIVLMGFMGFISFKIAYAIVFILNITMIALTASYLNKILKHYNINLKSYETLLMFFSILLFYPVISCILSGQFANNIILLSFTMVFYYTIVNKSAMPGFFLALATIFKIFPAGILLFSLYKKQFKTIIASGLFLLLAVILSVLVFGLEWNIDFVSNALGTQTIMKSNVNMYRMNSSISPLFFSILYIFNLNDNIINLLWLAVRALLFIGLITCLYMKYKNSKLNNKYADALVYSLIIISMVSLTNYNLAYYCIFYIPVIVLYLFIFNIGRLEKIALMVTVALLSFSMHTMYLGYILGGTFESIITSVGTTTYGSLLLLALVTYKIVRL